MELARLILLLACFFGGFLATHLAFKLLEYLEK